MTQQRHGGRLVAEQLASEGVDALFTLTGGHLSPVYDGCKDVGIRVIDVRHEQAAAHAADAYGRLTLRPGVAAVTAGPGVTDAITGVTNARYAGSPMVLLGGRNPLALEGMGALQDAPQVELLRPVTKRADVALEPRRLKEVLGYAFRDALTPRMGPTYVDLPMDVLMTPVERDQVVASHHHRFTHLPGPDPEAVAAAARELAAATKPVVIAGSGAFWSRASDELDQVATSGQLPVYVNGMARGLLPSSHPHLLTLSRKHALRNADLVLALGVDFDFRIGFGRPPAYADDVRVIHVDPEPGRVGHNRPVDLGVVSDVRAFLRALLEEVGVFGRKESTAWIDGLRDDERRRRDARDEAAASDASPVHPLRFAREVARFVDPDTIVIGDGGDVVAHTAGQVRIDRPGHWMDPGPFGCLGVGVPFALAAKHVHPGSQVLVVHGDGSFGFNGMEYDSAVRQDLPFVGVIGNDGAWGEMKAFHERIYGTDGMVAQDLSQETSYARMVEALGGHGERVDRPEDIVPALERAAGCGVAAVVDVVLDRSYRRDSAAAYGA